MHFHQNISNKFKRSKYIMICWYTILWVDPVSVRRFSLDVFLLPPFKIPFPRKLLLCEVPWPLGKIDVFLLSSAQKLIQSGLQQDTLIQNQRIHPILSKAFEEKKIHAFHKDINAKVNGIGYVEIIIRLAELIFYANKLTLSKYFINDVNKQ